MSTKLEEWRMSDSGADWTPSSLRKAMQRYVQIHDTARQNRRPETSFETNRILC